MSDENVREEDIPEGSIGPADLEDVEISDNSNMPLTEIAKEVIGDKRKWGVGQERRRRLSEAGYDVKEVEAEVVRLLNK